MCVRAAEPYGIDLGRIPLLTLRKLLDRSYVITDAGWSCRYGRSGARLGGLLPEVIEAIIYGVLLKKFGDLVEMRGSEVYRQYRQHLVKEGEALLRRPYHRRPPGMIVAVQPTLQFFAILWAGCLILRLLLLRGVGITRAAARSKSR